MWAPATVLQQTPNTSWSHAAATHVTRELPFVELQTEGDASTLPQQNTPATVEDLVGIGSRH